MITQHSNLNFASGKPKGLGDILMEQDRLRDFAWLWDRVGALFLDIVGGSAELVSGGVVTQGGTFSEINVTTAILYAPFSVTLGIDGNNPPGTGTEDITSIRISLPAQTNFSIAGATLDGVTVNYVKVKYSETENLTRSKLKATGTWAFTQLPSAVLTCDAVAPTSYEVAIATLVGDGTSVLTITQKYPLFHNLISSSGAYLALSSGSPYTLSAWQANQVDVTTGASDYVLNLPSVSAGMRIEVIKEDSAAGKVQITPNGADTINGVTGAAAWVISGQWGYVTLQSIPGGWETIAYLPSVSYASKSSNIAAEVNSKYILALNTDLTLPATASEGDVIKVKAIGHSNILQSDAEHVITYRGLYKTSSKGTPGFAALYGCNVNLIFKGAGGSLLAGPVKIADPATLPAGNGLGAAFSPDGRYLAVAENLSPYITIYQIAEAAAKAWMIDKASDGVTLF